MRIDEADWVLATERNRWVAVERLAANEARLASICRDYLAHKGDREEWARRLEEFEVA